MRWKTPYNSVPTKGEIKPSLQPSRTIPDQTLSVAEIMRRYAKGLPIDGEKVPVYHGDESDLPDLKRMDLSEIHDLKEAVKNEITDKQTSLKKQQAAKAKKRTQATLPLKDQNPENPPSEPSSKDKKPTGPIS